VVSLVLGSLSSRLRLLRLCFLRFLVPVSTLELASEVFIAAPELVVALLSVVSNDVVPLVSPSVVAMVGLSVSCVGVGAGAIVGTREGFAVGEAEGEAEGKPVGKPVGVAVGEGVGATVSGLRYLLPFPPLEPLSSLPFFLFFPPLLTLLGLVGWGFGDLRFFLLPERSFLLRDSFSP